MTTCLITFQIFSAAEKQSSWFGCFPKRAKTHPSSAAYKEEHYLRPSMGNYSTFLATKALSLAIGNELPEMTRSPSMKRKLKQINELTVGDLLFKQHKPYIQKGLVLLFATSPDNIHGRNLLGIATPWGVANLPPNRITSTDLFNKFNTTADALSPTFYRITQVGQHIIHPVKSYDPCLVEKKKARKAIKKLRQNELERYNQIYKASFDLHRT